MSEPKVIELTENQVEILNHAMNANGYDGLISDGQDVLLKAQQPKLVHLSDLPDGTVIKLQPQGDSYYLKSKNLYAVKKATGSYREHYGHIENMADQSFVLAPGEFQFWQGGECPWPEYVEVEVIYRDGKVDKNHGLYLWNDWKHQLKGEDIIAHRCTGRLLDGAKLVP